jgi:hypothetical protein
MYTLLVTVINFDVGIFRSELFVPAQLPEDGRLMPKHVEPVYTIKQRCKSVYNVGYFYYV